MDVLQFLRPIQSNHSVKEAVISVFLAQPIIKPTRFLSLITSNDIIKGKFQRAELLKGTKFQFAVEQGTPVFNPATVKDTGFRFTGFLNGKPALMLQGKNDESRYYLSFHTYNYSRWQFFFSDFKETISAVAELGKDLFAAAYSIQYVDSFEYNDSLDLTGSSPIPIKDFFKENDEILPKSFFNSSDSHFTLLTVKHESEKQSTYLDRLEIKVENGEASPILISHNISQDFDDYLGLNELLEGDFYQTLDRMHKRNKETLRLILQDKILERIGMSNQ